MGNDVDINFMGNDFQFLPFGAGRRICPGMNFSASTLEIMVANLMYRFNWEVPAAMGCIDMTEMFRLTVHRREKLILVPKMHVV
jgi:cytochrome P450